MKIARISPTWFDWLVYRLFYWRWNLILAARPDLRAVYRQIWEQYETQRNFWASQWNPEEWEPVRFVKGSSIDLDRLADDECTFPEPPTGWQVYKRKPSQLV